TMPWEVFAAKFGIPGADVDNARLVFDCCQHKASAGSAASGRAAEAARMQSIRYPGFEAAFELIEDKVYDRARSEEVFQPHYIRLVWVDPQGQLVPENAVVCRYDHAVQILGQVEVAQRATDAAQLSYRQVIDLR